MAVVASAAKVICPAKVPNDLTWKAGTRRPKRTSRSNTFSALETAAANTIPPGPMATLRKGMRATFRTKATK